MLAGHVRGPRDEPLRGVAISIAGTGGTVRRRTDAAGSYNALLMRGRYVVSAGPSTATPVRPPTASRPDARAASRSSAIAPPTSRSPRRSRSALMMPPRLVDANQDGMLDYPTTIDPAAFEVWIRVSRAGGGRCDTSATYAFVLDGHPVGATPGPEPCVSVLKARDQGRHTVAVTGTAADGTRSRGEDAVTVRDFLIVGLGDSVGSGEGNPDIPGYLGDGFRWQEPRCDRSAHSFEAQAAESIEQGSRMKASVTFLHLACSGAGLDIGVTGPYFGIAPGGQSLPLRSQISELDRSAGSRKVDAAIVSIGANDIGFGDIVSFCALHSECDQQTFKDGKTLSAVTRSRISRLPELYATLARRLKAAGVPAARVFITQYYDPLRGADGRFCPSTVGLMSAREGAWAYNSVMRRLNVQVATAAQQWGWQLVTGAQQGFRTHGYCSASSWIVGLAQSLDTQGNERGTMHPNVAGHTFIARRVLELLRPELLPGGVPRAVD